MLDIANSTKLFFETQEQQAMLLRDIVVNMRNDCWTDLATNQAENQPGPLIGQLEGLIDIQGREIKELQDLLKEKEYQMRDKEHLLKEKDSQVSRLEQRIEKANKLMEAREQQVELSPGSSVRESAESEYLDGSIYEEPASENSGEERDSENSEEKTSSGVSCEEPVFSSANHLSNWKNQQTSSLDLSIQGPQNCKIKVSKLPRDVNRQQLTSVFGASGTIKDITIGKKSKSAVAIITYQQHGSAVNATKTQSGRYFNGTPMTVEFYEEYPDSRNGPSLSFASTLQQQGEWQSGSSLDSLDFSTVPMKFKANAVRIKNETDCPKDRTIYVKEFPFDVTEKALQKSFEQFGAIESIDIKRREGYAFAFIRYKSVQMAKTAKIVGSVIVGNVVCRIGSTLK